MLNRATSQLADCSDDARGDAAWDVDQNPALRLSCLGVFMVLPLLAVLGRLAYLQTQLLDDVVAQFERTSSAIESIPAPDGRILAADGRVLAADEQRFAVLAHYRWLENPPQPEWLRQRALAALSQSERRQPEKVAKKLEQARAACDNLWDRLAVVSGTSPLELTARRQRVQKRVERIKEQVERRRAERQQTASSAGQGASAGAEETADDSLASSWLRRAWRSLSHAVTTTPGRGTLDPVVVQEELDYHLILDNIPLVVAAEIEAHPERYPGLRITTTTRRIYPHGELACHLVGSRLPAGIDEIERRAEQFPDGDPFDYREGDRIGRAGIERIYDALLRGVRGERRITRNRRGEILKVETVREPRPGRDLVLTLNLPLQEQMERLLEDLVAGEAAADPESDAAPVARGAAIVALDVHTGRVITAASAPRFDLGLLMNPDPDRWRRLVEDPRRPFLSRTVQMAIPPGSVFKTLTGIALMESGRFDPDEKYFCQGFLDRPDRHRCFIYRHYGVGHAEMDLTDALAQSCNVYFFHGAREVGPHTLVDWAARFGFGQPTGIDLPGERSGNLPIPPEDLAPTASAARHVRRDAPWYPGDTLGLAIGQAQLTATPMQVARMMAAVANGGYLVTPYVVDHTATGFHEGRDVLAHPEPVRIPGLTPGTLERIREGLEKVVAHPRGTGYKHVRLKEIAIAGKTGTAEVGGGKPDHAWFAGYAPADNPRIAFVVALEHAGSGGQIAGPVARTLVQALLEKEW